MFCGGKKTYTKKEAQTAINGFKKRSGKQDKRQPKKIPIRSYHCENCNGWHLTSKQS